MDGRKCTDLHVVLGWQSEIMQHIKGQRWSFVDVVASGGSFKEVCNLSIMRFVMVLKQNYDIFASIHYKNRSTWRWKWLSCLCKLRERFPAINKAYVLCCMWTNTSLQPFRTPLKVPFFLFTSNSIHWSPLKFVHGNKRNTEIIVIRNLEVKSTMKRESVSNFNFSTRRGWVA